MNSTRTKIHAFFANLLPFAQLSKAELADLADKSEFNRYRMGQTVLMREQMPGEIIIVFSGQIRLLAYHPQHQTPTRQIDLWRAMRSLTTPPLASELSTRSLRVEAR